MLIYFSLLPTGCDAAQKWQLGSQEAATPSMSGIVELHNDIGYFLVLILGFVSRIWARAFMMFPFPKAVAKIWFVHGPTIELLRTIYPSIIPIGISIPSFALLYALDELVEPITTLKAIGHQWFRKGAASKRASYIRSIL